MNTAELSQSTELDNNCSINVTDDECTHVLASIEKTEIKKSKSKDCHYQMVSSLATGGSVVLGPENNSIQSCALKRYESFRIDLKLKDSGDESGLMKKNMRHVFYKCFFAHCLFILIGLLILLVTIEFDLRGLGGGDRKENLTNKGSVNHKVMYHLVGSIYGASKTLN